MPEFIIAGAARSGTTWLYECLDRHPQIYMAKPRQPEPKFFLIDHIYAKGLKWYARQYFENHQDANILSGEKSSGYLEGGAVTAQRINQHLPQVKLIFLLRNPVDRAYSNYLWSKKNGFENLEFERAIQVESERERTLKAEWREVRPFAYLKRGTYAKLLKPYFSLFPAEQILCIRFEDLVEDPRAFIKQVHDFLKVTYRKQDVRGLGRPNASQRDTTRMAPQVRAKLNTFFKEPNRDLQKLLDGRFKVWDGA